MEYPSGSGHFVRQEHSQDYVHNWFHRNDATLTQPGHSRSTAINSLPMSTQFGNAHGSAPQPEQYQQWEDDECSFVDTGKLWPKSEKARPIKLEFPETNVGISSYSQSQEQPNFYDNSANYSGIVPESQIDNSTLSDYNHVIYNLDSRSMIMPSNNDHQPNTMFTASHQEATSNAPSNPNTLNGDYLFMSALNQQQRQSILVSPMAPFMNSASNPDDGQTNYPEFVASNFDAQAEDEDEDDIMWLDENGLEIQKVYLLGTYFSNSSVLQPKSEPIYGEFPMTEPSQLQLHSQSASVPFVFGSVENNSVNEVLGLSRENPLFDTPMSGPGNPFLSSTAIENNSQQMVNCNLTNVDGSPAMIYASTSNNVGSFYEHYDDMSYIDQPPPCGTFETVEEQTLPNASTNINSSVIASSSLTARPAEGRMFNRSASVPPILNYYGNYGNSIINDDDLLSTTTLATNTPSTTSRISKRVALSKRERKANLYLELIHKLEQNSSAPQTGNNAKNDASTQKENSQQASIKVVNESSSNSTKSTSSSATSSNGSADRKDLISELEQKKNKLNRKKGEIKKLKKECTQLEKSLETEEDRKARLEKGRKKKQEKRAKMTPEQKEDEKKKRKKYLKNYWRKKLAAENNSDSG